MSSSILSPSPETVGYETFSELPSPLPSPSPPPIDEAQEAILYSNRPASPFERLPDDALRSVIQLTGYTPNLALASRELQQLHLSEIEFSWDEVKSALLQDPRFSRHLNALNPDLSAKEQFKALFLRLKQELGFLPDSVRFLSPFTALFFQQMMFEIGLNRDLSLRAAWPKIRTELQRKWPQEWIELFPIHLTLPAFDASHAVIRQFLYNPQFQALFDRVEELNFWECGLPGIPEELKVFRGLRRLYLHENQIRGVPLRAFQGLVQLEMLYLNDNEISSLSEGVFRGLTRLSILQLQNNRIETLPPRLLEDQAVLLSGSFANNQIQVIPPSFSLFGDRLDFTQNPLMPMAAEAPDIIPVEPEMVNESLLQGPSDPNSCCQIQ